MKLRTAGTLAAVTALAFAACNTAAPGSSGAAGTGGATGKVLKIGTELPMSGAETANGEPTANGVKLAIKQANAQNLIPGYTIDINVQDDAVNGAHDPQQGATNMHTLVADAAVRRGGGPAMRTDSSSR